MAMNIRGRLSSWELQPGSTVVERDDGTIEGSAVFEGPASEISYAPRLGESHPKDRRLECYTREVVFTKLEKAQVVCSYFGIDGTKTDTIYSMPGGQSTRPIETHPNFAEFATSENGAKFDDDGLFLGFGDRTKASWFGVQYYFEGTTPVSGVYWTSREPKLEKRGTIKASLRGFRTPPGVGDFLLVDTPYRRVGSFYQVTEQWLGSGENGWNPTIYTD